MMTGWSTRDIENLTRQGNTSEIDARLAPLDNVRFSFDGSITLDDLDDELMAYAMTYGDWPEVIVIDNLSNVVQDDLEGYHALEATCDYLHELARKTGAAVIALHHVTGAYDDGTEPVPLSGLRGKVSKVPEMVLTLSVEGNTWETGERRLIVSIVKNRGGKGDASGSLKVALRCDLDRMLIQDIPKTGEGYERSDGQQAW